MGRQAYLTKIALGRSAFEPSQNATQSSEYIQLAPSQQELPQEIREFNANRYVQLYDERGNPMNPRAHDHGRRLREAQNDVLAAIGVVERRRSPSQDLPGSYEERLQQLDDEDTVGNVIALAATLTENACTWWIGSLRERILTFRIQEALPFAQVVASEHSLSGPSILYSGFLPRLVSTLSIQATVYAAFKLRPFERFVLTKQTSRARRLHRRWRHLPRIGLRLLLELVFYPFAHHSHLQRLGLIPATPLLPPLKAFLPFSPWSPLNPFSSYAEAFASPIQFLKAVVTSPFVFVYLQHFSERWVYAIVNEAIEVAVIHPDSPDIHSPNESEKHQTSNILGLRKRSPQIVRSAINKVLGLIGWGSPTAEEPDREMVTQSMDRLGVREGQTIEVGGRQVTNINRLELPLAHQLAPPDLEPLEGEEVAIPVPLANETLPPLATPSPPPSPTASQVSQNDDNDPRIRITSREGIVEMEVRLPPHVLSSHTEVEGSGLSTPSQRDLASPNPVRIPDIQTYHRVSQLSSEPAQMIGAICKSQIVSWVSLPLRIVTLRLVASHYLASRHGHSGARSVLHPLPALSELTWPSIGVQMSRIALCGALELAIDLSLWGCQYLAVTWVGIDVFGWGTL